MYEQYYFPAGGIAQELGDGIFEFDGNDWKMVGKLSKRREFPGIAHVDVTNLEFCQQISAS